jgi:hypothetical protein
MALITRWLRCGDFVCFLRGLQMFRQPSWLAKIRPGTDVRQSILSAEIGRPKIVRQM